MPERPLLVFPQYEPVNRIKKRGGGGRPKIPDHETLIHRQRQQISSLISEFREKKFSVRLSAVGLEPEKVLVIKINGSIRNFLNLCEKTEGVEFLADIDLEDIDDDPDYPDANDGKLILSITNEDGIRRILSWWNNYKKDPDYSFPHGYAQWKHIFEQINEIRFWDYRDRLYETGTLQNWQFQIEYFGKEEIETEIELFYRKEPEKRDAAQDEITRLCTDEGGEVLKRLTIPEIRYHGVLVRLPADVVHRISREEDVRLVHNDFIMYFRPTGQHVSTGEDSNMVDPELHDESMAETDNPQLAIFDGLPIQNHQYIRNHLQVVDPDQFETNYPAARRKHGTSMVSLIINGDLNETDDDFIPDNTVYLRPILKYNSVEQREVVPEGELFIDLIHRAVVELKDDQADGSTRRESVKVIHLTVCDSNRLFHHELSSLAKLLDWLSWKYNILFIVSGGNQTDSIQIPREVKGFDFQELPVDQQRNVLYERIHQIQRFRRLMAPSESINAVTIGAAHNDHSNVQYPNKDLIGVEGLPAAYNPVSFGFRKSVKPEILCTGGKSVFRLRINQQFYQAKMHDRVQEPGCKVAYPSAEGNIQGIAHDRGTSVATAMASRNSLKIIKMLNELNSQDEINIPESYYPVVVKCLLTHSCAWDKIQDHLERSLKNEENAREFKKIVQRYAGYGVSKIDRSLECLENRATIIGVGTLNKDEGHRYRIPLPECIDNTRLNRRLVMTLAWISPVNTEHAFYRRAHLTMEQEGTRLFLNSNPIKEAHAQTFIKGTVEHRVESAKSRVSLNDNENMFLKITCREDAGLLDDPIRYALAVTMENRSEVDLPIYEQVRERLRVSVRPRV